MFTWGKREAEAPERVRQRLAEAEIRLASLATEVHEATRKLEVWGAREVARQAAFEEAWDKLFRQAERIRKSPRGRDGDASDSNPADLPDSGLEDFLRLYERLGGSRHGG